MRPRTLLGNVGERSVHVGEAEDVGEQARDGDGEVVHPDAALARGGRVQDGALEVGVDLFVELALVLDPGGDGLVGVERAKFEIGDVALEEVAKVVRHAKAWRDKLVSVCSDSKDRQKRTVGAADAHGDAVARFPLGDALDLGPELAAVADGLEARVEEEFATGDSGKNTWSDGFV